MKKFKNLVFDLGDVIIDIDYKTVMAEFQKLAIVDFEEIIAHFRKQKLLDLFETGKISADQFRSELKKFMRNGTTDMEINHAWNSIMTDFPESKFALLKELKSRYKVFALSNTNEIHVTNIHAIIELKFGEKNLQNFFHHTYYSNEVGFRKPEKEIYEWLLQKENLIADETLFVDDLLENIETAKQLGLHAYQLKDRNKLQELLAGLNIL